MLRFLLCVCVCVEKLTEIKIFPFTITDDVVSVAAAKSLADRFPKE